MNRLVFCSILPLAFLVQTSVAQLEGLADSADRADISIELLRNVTVNTPEIHIQDVAKVEGGDFFLARKIKRLDLVDMINVESTSVRRSLIEVRMRLAGIDTDRVRFTGALLSQVRFAKPSIDREIVGSLRQPLADHWKVDSDDVELRLSRPIPTQTATRLQQIDDYALRPFIDTDPAPGQLRVKLGAYQNEQLLFVFNVTVQASVHMNVAVANRDLPARSVLRAEDFSMERRKIEERNDLSNDAITVGKQLRRGIREGAIITANDLQVASQFGGDRGDSIVKRRDIVRVVARKKGLSVSLLDAEALQDGRVGQRIRVRNSKTRKILVGQVVGRGTVEISL